MEKIMKNYGLGFIDFIEAFHILTPNPCNSGKTGL